MGDKRKPSPIDLLTEMVREANENLREAIHALDSLIASIEADPVG